MDSEIILESDLEKVFTGSSASKLLPPEIIPDNNKGYLIFEFIDAGIILSKEEIKIILTPEK